MFLTIVLCLTLMIVCALFAWKADKTDNKYLLLPIILLLSLISGLRAFSVGLDTKNYVTKYFQPSFNGDFAASPGEIGFDTVVFALGCIWRNEHFVFFVFALATQAFFVLRFWDFRKDGSFVFMIIVYFAQFYFNSFNIFRQCFAMSLLFYGTRYLHRQEYLLYCLYNLFALFFHISAALGLGYVVLDLLLYKRLREPQKLKKFLLIVAAGVGGVALLAFIVQPKIFSLAYGKIVARLSGGFRLDLGAMLPLKLLLFCLFTMFVFEKTRFGVALSQKVYGARNREEGFSYFANRQEYREIYQALEKGEYSYRAEECLIARREKEYSVYALALYYLVGILATFLAYFIENGQRFGLYFYIFETVYVSLLVKKDRSRGVGLIYVLLFAYVLFGEFTGNGQGAMPYIFIG